MEVDDGRMEEERARMESTSLLARAGDGADGPRAVEEQLEYVVERVVGDASRYPGGEAVYWDMSRKALVACGTELAHKVSMYATITGLLAVSKVPEAVAICERVAASTAGLLVEAVRDGHGGRGRRAMRFLCELCNARVISGEWMLDLMRMFLEAGVNDLTGSDKLHARSSFLLDILASSLPWAARGMRREDAGVDADFDALVMEVVEALDRLIAEERQWAAMQLGTSENSCQYRFKILRDAIAELADEERVWKTGAIQQWESGTFKSRLDAGPEISLRSIQLPSHSKLSRYSPPRFMFRLGEGANTAAEETAVTDKTNKRYKGAAERFILLEVTCDVLDNFRSQHVKAAEKLLTIPIPMEMNREIVEATFSELCRLPLNKHPLIFYSAIFADLCRVKDSRLPLKLMSAVESIYDNISWFDPEALDRLSEWFAFHLSNFGYKWNWADWSSCGAEDARQKVPFKRVFCRDVIDHMCRLSYRDHILSVIPTDLHGLVPPEPSAAGSGGAKNNDAMNNNDTAESSEENVQKVIELTSGSERRSTGEIRARLLGIFGEGQEAEILRCFVVILIRAGTKTLTHFDASLERNLEVIIELINTLGPHEGPRSLFAELWGMWEAAPLRSIYFMDKFCTYRVLEPETCIELLLSDAGLDLDQLAVKLEMSTVWECLRLIFVRQRSRINVAQQEVSTAARYAASATEGEVDEASQRLQEAKSALENIELSLKKMIFDIFTKLDMLCDRLKEGMDEMQEEEDEGETTSRKVWEWRVTGFCTELVRKNSDILEKYLDHFDSIIETGGLQGEFLAHLKTMRAYLTADISLTAL